MIELPASSSRTRVFEIASTFLTDWGFRVVDEDLRRPWGGFFVVDEAHCADFVASFFPDADEVPPADGRKRNPKLLLVAPGKRLSWQYHARRSELWRVLGGEVGVAISSTNEQPPPRRLRTGDMARIGVGERHRLIGLETWAAIAELWEHTDPKHPSDEEDIVRIQDDFGR